MKETIALRLDPETREKLELLSEASGYSPATLVAEAVRRFVDVELVALAAAQAEQMAEGKGGAAAPIRWKLKV